MLGDPKPKDANILTEQMLTRIAGTRVAGFRTEIAQLRTEIGIVRSALPDPMWLLDIAGLLDKLVPDDPEPALQDALRLWAEQIRQVVENSGTGVEAFGALECAVRYVDAHTAYKVAMDQGASMKEAQVLYQAAEDAHERFVQAIESARGLIPEKTTDNGKKETPDGT